MYCTYIQNIRRSIVGLDGILNTRLIALDRPSVCCLGSCLDEAGLFFLVFPLPLYFSLYFYSSSLVFHTIFFFSSIVSRLYARPVQDLYGIMSASHAAECSLVVVMVCECTFTKRLSQKANRTNEQLRIAEPELGTVLLRRRRVREEICRESQCAENSL